MMTLDERLDKAEEMIKKPSFRENKGLGNELFDLSECFTYSNNELLVMVAVKK